MIIDLYNNQIIIYLTLKAALMQEIAIFLCLKAAGPIFILPNLYRCK